MPRRSPTPIARHRARLARKGFARVEVSVRKEDASIIRAVAAALSDPAHQGEARRLLRPLVALEKRDLKALLAAAPLEGIDLIRPADPGREVEL